jgi:hypothetical protein
VGLMSQMGFEVLMAFSRADSMNYFRRACWNFYTKLVGDFYII